ncbi:MAG: hypothetical protein E2577_17455, partial [Starkeya sp.]|nr:hypothetical protein [Starkeya sp.]
MKMIRSILIGFAMVSLAGCTNISSKQQGVCPRPQGADTGFGARKPGKLVRGEPREDGSAG